MRFTCFCSGCVACVFVWVSESEWQFIYSCEWVHCAMRWEGGAKFKMAAALHLPFWGWSIFANKIPLNCTKFSSKRSKRPKLQRRNFYAVWNETKTKRNHLGTYVTRSHLCLAMMNEACFSLTWGEIYTEN